VRGRGLLAGIELVEDAATRRPFDRSLRVAETLADEAQAAGLVVWPNAGQAAGGKGDLILIGPPFVIGEEEISELMRLLRSALDATWAMLRDRMDR
jgi:hypothetical protein